ncbi:MAG: ATP-binding cassette domain-containing protein [Spirochaetes bacterium]|nr:ATP-binding cassette domain-containing protein [Spirochaetota bacterium]
MSLIDVNGLYFSREALPVLEDVNFTIEEKQMVTIVGPNGGGKTTLLLLLLGLLSPDRGQILIKGRRPAAVQRLMGYVPQYSLFDPTFPVTVYDVVLMGSLRRFWGFYTKADHEAVDQALATVGLCDLAQRSFSELSGGQRQRVLIARALVGRPEILLLDEPTANVDAAVGEHLNELLRRLNQDLTILLVTHDDAFVSNFTTRVFCINRGFTEHPARQLQEGAFVDALYQTPVAAVHHGIHLDGHHHAGESGQINLRGGCTHD